MAVPGHRQWGAKRRRAELDGRLRQGEEHVLAGLDAPDRAVLRSLLQRLAMHANDLDPVASAGDAVQDIDAVEVAASNSWT